MFPPGTRGRARGLPYTMDAFMLGMGMLSESHTQVEDHDKNTSNMDPKYKNTGLVGFSKHKQKSINTLEEALKTIIIMIIIILKMSRRETMKSKCQKCKQLSKQ